MRQLLEKYRKNNKKLFMGLVDLETAYDRAPRELSKWK